MAAARGCGHKVAFSEHRLCFMERRHLQLESVSLWQLFASFMLQQATGVRAG